ncbi:MULTISPECIES: ABC transporter ATP-binding protein [Bacillaceae]|uniref:ABC transporter ATP-binding protein n=1 Tax=Evansella alkalicola TaxID=745819 RepID=A0ABS6JQ14_9BACI|nr:MULTISPECIES: ABC transporter ATP-binding protein [Bacillaceae]MBU9720656.1 ABC transporter ATP-binding protein [Bacillus alkalicola]
MTYHLEVWQGMTNYRRFQLGPIDLQIPKGMITAVIGRNGAGKTTMLKGLCGLPPFQKGKVYYRGVEIDFLDPTIRKYMTYISNDIQMYSDFTVNQAIEFVASLHETWDEDWFHLWLTKFKVRTDVQIHELSKGMKMKLNLLFGLGHQPKIVLLDEPTDGLDSISRQQFFDLLQAYIADNNCSIIISTHYTKDVEGICDHVVFMRDGQVTEYGEVEEIRQNYRLFSLPPNEMIHEREGVIAITTGVETKGVVLTELVDTLPENVVIKKPTLDDIFLYVVENGGDVS